MAAPNTLVLRVVYRSPILIDAFFAPPTALCAPQRVERSDQIEGTEATCGPRRPKGLVMVTQGHGEHPATASRRRILSKNFTTTRFWLRLTTEKTSARISPRQPLSSEHRSPCFNAALACSFIYTTAILRKGLGDSIERPGRLLYANACAYHLAAHQPRVLAPW